MTGAKAGVPVGVFEADASLLQLVGIFQLGHILGVDGRFSHGFLGTKDITVIGAGPLESTNGARRLRSVGVCPWLSAARLQAAAVLLL